MNCSIVGSPEAQVQAKYEIEMIVAGTPVHGSKNASNSQYYDSGSLWNTYGYYGDAYSSYSYGSYYDQSTTQSANDPNTNVHKGNELNVPFQINDLFFLRKSSFR